MAKEKVGTTRRMKASIVGNRPLLQHQFTPDAIPLEGRERTGVAGNDPEEWKRTRMVTPDGQLYVRADYIYSTIRAGAAYTRSGKGSIQPRVAATLVVEDSIVLLDRWMPKTGDPKHNDYGSPVYVDVCGVTLGVGKAARKNVRYRLACSPGWRCTFTIRFDVRIVNREQMKASIIDGGLLVGLADGRKIGYGRYDVESIEEIE